MNEVLLIGGMFLATFSARFVLFAMAGRIQFPPWLSQALGYVPPVVLTAIIVPAVVMPQGDMWMNWHNPWLVAGLIAAATAVIRKDLLTTIIIGMLAFAALKFL